MSNLVKLFTILPIPIVGGYFLYDRYGGNSSGKTPSYVKESIEVLKGYQPAIEKLGWPVEAQSIDKKDPFNKIDLNNVQAKVPIQGSRKRSADLIIYAARGEQEKKWTINQLEIKYSGTKATYKFYDRSLIREN